MNDTDFDQNMTVDTICNLTASVDIGQCQSGSEFLASIVLHLVGLGCNGTDVQVIQLGEEERRFIQTIIRAKVDEVRAADRPSLIPLTVMFALIAFAGMIGNLCVLYIFSRKMTMTNLTYFVVTLAVVDLLTCVVVIPGTAAQAWYTAFNTDVLCKAWQLVRYSVLFTPSFLLVAVAMERYILICHPTLAIVSSRCLRLCLAAVLATGVMLGIPPMLSAGTYIRIRDTNIMVHVGLCINNYILISRQAVGHYWIAVSIMYATFSVSLALLYGLIFRYLYRRRHRWRPRTTMLVQPTETIHITETDTGPTGSRTNVQQDNSGMRSSLRNVRKVSFPAKNTNGTMARKASIFEGKDRTLMFRNHSMYPDYVDKLNTRRAEILQRDHFMSEGELAAIFNQPYTPPTTKRRTEKLVPRQSTITSVSSLTTEYTEVSNEFPEITPPKQSGVKRYLDNRTMSGSSLTVPITSTHPNVPLQPHPSVSKDNDDKCIKTSVTTLDCDSKEDNVKPITRQPNEQRLFSENTSKAMNGKPLDEALVRVGGISHEDIIPVATRAVSTVNLQLVAPATPCYLSAACHTQVSREGPHCAVWSSPHVKTAIVWFTVTVTFIMAYTPMLLIQTRVIPPFRNSRFLYFLFLFIAALNPIIYSVLNRAFTEALCRLLPCNIFRRIFKCKSRDTAMKSQSKVTPSVALA